MQTDLFTGTILPGWTFIGTFLFIVYLYWTNFFNEDSLNFKNEKREFRLTDFLCGLIFGPIAFILILVAFLVFLSNEE